MIYFTLFLLCILLQCDGTLHFIIDKSIYNNLNNITIKLDIYEENHIHNINNNNQYFFLNYNISLYIDSIIIYKDQNIYNCLDQYCNDLEINELDCITLLSYCKNNLIDDDKIRKHYFLVLSSPYDETIGGIVLCHYLVDRLNYFFSSNGNPIAYMLQILSDDRNTTKFLSYNPKYNTPVITKLQYMYDDDLIVIQPEAFHSNILNKKMLVRWILYFLNLKGNTIQGAYQYDSNDYIACYSKGICREFNDNWHKHPLRVIDLNWDMFDTIDSNRMRDIDIVYFKPQDRKRFWMNNRGENIILDYDNAEYILNGLFTLLFMNKTIIRMDQSMGKYERLELLSRSNYFISLDPATFRSVEAAMVGCLSIVIPVSGVTKEEWSSVSYAPEYLRYGIAYGFEDLDHARKTLELVIPNLQQQDMKTKENLVNFLKDVKDYFNLDTNFMKEKLE